MNDSKVSARQKALTYLARREHSVRELIFKLEQKGFSATEIDETITKLLKANFLSNTRFAESLIKARISQGVGPNRIKAELKSHDIQAVTFQDLEVWQEVDWMVVATRVFRKKWSQSANSDPKQVAKQLQFLIRKGFDRDTAQAAIANPDELPFLG